MSLSAIIILSIRIISTSQQMAKIIESICSINHKISKLQNSFNCKPHMFIPSHVEILYIQLLISPMCFIVLVSQQVQVEMAITEGKEKGPIIVEEAKRQTVSLLVLGQKRKSIVWRLMNRWSSKKKAVGDIVDYCIQNSSRMTIAVRRKSSKLGGYLITTKRHKNFWLLA